MASVPVYQVDAFITEKPFSGNPAAICLLAERFTDTEWMQNIAMEMNLSETAFLVSRDDGFDLRWFTPTVEVALCGHATLASAHILWEIGVLVPRAQARFHTKSGLLTCYRREDGWIEMDFPAKRGEPVIAPPGLLDALGISARYVGKNAFDYLVEVESEAMVRELQPDMNALQKFQARGIIVTSRATMNGYDFVSRFFAPGSGVDEDPVTGSAHCALGPYWMQRLGKKEFIAYQASRRGGVIQVRSEGERVFLAGRATTVFRGELL